MFRRPEGWDRRFSLIFVIWFCFIPYLVLYRPRFDISYEIRVFQIGHRLRLPLFGSPLVWGYGYALLLNVSTFGEVGGVWGEWRGSGGRGEFLGLHAAIFLYF